MLVAPSWGKNSLLENLGAELVEVLLGTGHHITVRPHVMTIRHRRNLLGQMQKQFGPNPKFALDLSLRSQGVMHEYDLLIADWGGSALEYAFGLERPVLFVDVPRKVFNPEYERLPCIPIEVQARSDIGDIVSPDRLLEVPERIERLLEDTTVRKNLIIEARSRWVYNIGSSGKVGAKYISSTADKLRNGA